MNKRPRSLQGRLLLLVLGMVVAIWLTTAIATWLDARHELEELLDSHLAQAAALLVIQQRGEFDDDDRSIDAPQLHRYAPKVAFQVFHDGHLALRSGNAPLRPMLADALAKPGFATVQIDGMTWRVFTAEGAEQDVLVYVGEQVDARASILWAILRSALWPMVVALPLLALAVWWSVHRGVAPIRALGRALAERQPEALQPVSLDNTLAELTPMIDALNGLFARIAALLESERRFTADAAHELRTPIAAIRAQAQVALGETDAGLRAHALQSTLDGCDRATRLVEQLLTLSQLEATTPTFNTINLSALIRQVTASLVPKALSKNQTLELDAGESCNLSGNEILLTVLARNLIDNALRYSPPFARIKVTVQQHDGNVRLSVEDSGAGLSEANLGKLGERFFRVLGNTESGSGLGWSIIRRIAAVHRLELQIARSTELGGLAVHVIGPANSALS